MHRRPRGSTACTHTMCDIVARNKPERSIGFQCESITLFERHFGQDYKEDVREMALDALTKFGPGTPFEKDERMLPIYRILGRYSKSMTASEVYDSLYEKNLYLRSVQFYVDWADSYLAANNPTRAMQIIAHADTACGADHPLLETMKETIERRMMSMQMMGGPPDNMSRPPPPYAALDAQLADIRVGALVGRAPLTFTAPPPSQGDIIRRSLAPIQAPQRAVFAAPPPVMPPPGLEKNNYEAGTSMETDEKFVLPPTKGELFDDSNKENEGPVVPISATTFVLPHIVETAPISPDMISPSLAQMKPGRPNNFILPPVFTFADAARPKTAQ